MAYATLDDAIALYGLGEVDAALDRARDAAVDADAIAIFETALEAASSEIDTWLAARYDVPVSPVPAAIRVMTIDLAIHRVALRSGVVREEWKDRAGTVRAQLKDLAKGLGGLPGVEPAGSSDAGTADGDIGIVSRPRRFAGDGSVWP